LYEHKRHEHVADLQKKEDDMRQMFVVRVKEKEGELKEAEKEVKTTTTTLLIYLNAFYCYVTISLYFHAIVLFFMKPRWNIKIPR